MRKTDTDIVRLLCEYLTGRIDDSHRQQLQAWIEESKEHRLFFERIYNDRTFVARWKLRQQISEEAAIRAFDRRTRGRAVATLRRWAYASIAAGVLLIAGASLLLLRQQSPEPTVVAGTELFPGERKAVLILANGVKMQLAPQDSLSVSLGADAHLCNKDRQLVYQGKAADSVQYNELQIPRGGEYQVVLSDGTTVRLNSGSSLKYPVVFGKDKREVELTGEAYFKVNKATVPFLVKVGEMKVKVYGTTFNINSHAADRIQTALVEGKVGITVAGNQEEYVLNPSQVAEFDVSSGNVRIQTTDLEPYVAWTQGKFIFYNESLQQIMSTLALWYDVEVFYQNPSLQDLHFSGCVKRYEQIDTILRALSQSVGVKFNRRGKTLIVSD